MTARLSTVCTDERHAICGGCQCQCHDKPMPGWFRQRVEEAREGK